MAGWTYRSRAAFYQVCLLLEIFTSSVKTACVWTVDLGAEDWFLV